MSIVLMGSSTILNLSDLRYFPDPVICRVSDFHPGEDVVILSNSIGVWRGVVSVRGFLWITFERRSDGTYVPDSKGYPIGQVCCWPDWIRTDLDKTQFKESSSQTLPLDLYPSSLTPFVYPIPFLDSFLYQSWPQTKVGLGSHSRSHV